MAHTKQEIKELLRQITIQEHGSIFKNNPKMRDKMMLDTAIQFILSIYDEG